MKDKSVLITVESIETIIELLTNYMLTYIDNPDYKDDYLYKIFLKKQELVIKLERLNARKVYSTDKNEYSNIMSHVTTLRNGISIDK